MLNMSNHPKAISLIGDGAVPTKMMGRIPTQKTIRSSKKATVPTHGRTSQLTALFCTIAKPGNSEICSGACIGRYPLPGIPRHPDALPAARASVQPLRDKPPAWLATVYMLDER